MPDLLGKASDWLQRQRHAHLTIGVTYARGDSQVALQATIGRSLFETADEYGRILTTESRDYIIRAEDLALDGATTLPAPGDTITEDARVYEVMSPPGEPEYRWVGARQENLRIHTKQIAG